MGSKKTLRMTKAMANSIGHLQTNTLINENNTQYCRPRRKLDNNNTGYMTCHRHMLIQAYHFCHMTNLINRFRINGPISILLQ